MGAHLWFKRNSSTILTVLGAAGVVVTTVMAVKATPKAALLLEEAEKEKGEELTKTEVVITAGPVYIPTILVGLSTIMCIFSSNMLNKKQQASITSAYALLNTSFKDYKNKVKEMYGEDIEEEVRHEIAKDKYDEDEVTDTDDGKELFFDEFSGRYFRSTKDKVLQASYYMNRDLTMRDYVYLNEYYDYLEIPGIESGWDLGWSVGACFDMYWQNWIDFNYSKTIMDDGLECTHITMFQEPIIDFENYC